MKMKRAIVIILVLSMAFIAGCGLYSDDEPDTATQTSQTTAAQAAEASTTGGDNEQTTANDATTATAAATTTAAAAATEQATDTNPLIEQYPEFAEHHEVQFLCFEQGWTGPEADKDFITPEIAERTNFLFKYEPQTVTTSEDLQAKLNLMMTSGEAPDIYFGPASAYYRDVCRRMGEAGMIWNYAPYIKEYPNIYELLKPELLKHYDIETKSIYFLPTQTGRGNDPTGMAPNGEFCIRRDYLEKLNMDYPTTPEELYDYLVACKDLPDVGGKPVIPLAMDENLSGVEDLIRIFRTLPDRIGDLWGFDPYNNYEFYNILFTDSPELIRAAKYINKLYREGLIDREALTIKRDQFMEKMSSGRVALARMPMWDLTTFSDQAKQVVPELFYVATPDLYDKANGLPLHPDMKWTYGIGFPSTLTMSTKMDEATFRHFLAVLDYLATRDGQILVQVGIEGVSFEYADDGKYYFTDDFLQKTDDLDWNKASAYGVFYYQQVVFNFPVYKDIEGVSAELLRPEHMAGWENKQDRRDRFDPDMMPYKSQYLEEGEKELTLMPAINEAKLQFYANILTAKDDADVERVVSEWAKICVDLGIDQVIEEKINALNDLVILSDLE